MSTNDREKQREYERRYRHKDPEHYRRIQRAASRRARDRRTPEQREKVLEKQREYDRRRREDPVVRERARENEYLRRYGLTIAERELIVAKGCAICGGVATHLDHDHTTGAVRDGLCGGCNVGLGMFSDDPARLRAAALYLEAHRG